MPHKPGASTVGAVPKRAGSLHGEDFRKLHEEFDRIFTTGKQELWKHVEELLESQDPLTFRLPPSLPPSKVTPADLSLPGQTETGSRPGSRPCSRNGSLKAATLTIERAPLPGTLSASDQEEHEDHSDLTLSQRPRASESQASRKGKLDESLRSDRSLRSDHQSALEVPARRKDRKASTVSVGPLTDIVPQVKNSKTTAMGDKILAQSQDLSVQERRRRRRQKAEKNCALISSERNEKMLADATLPERLTKSKCFKGASSAIILLNCVFMGWTTESLAQKQAGSGIPDNTLVLGLQLTFTIFFTLELMLQWWAEGLIGFFKSEDVGWHLLDMLCVAIGIADSLLEILVLGFHVGSEAMLSQFTVVRVIRIVRILRVVRVSKIMQMCRELRMMVFSTVNCLKSVLWISIILFVIFYMFAIVFTSAAASFLDGQSQGPSPEDRLPDLGHQELRRHFGSLSQSMLSLYMAMSGGNNWTVYYSALASMENGSVYCGVFLLYITFMLFAVVNIVTGVFVDAAMQSSRADQSVVVQHELETKKQYLESLKALYEAIDENSDGLIRRETLEASFQNESVLAYLSALKLNVPDASTLFDLLDFDHSDAIEIDEFLLGCYNLHGDASNIDVKLTHAEVRFVKEAVLDLCDEMQDLRDQMTSAQILPLQ